MTVLSQQARIGLRRFFTIEGLHPYEQVDWQQRRALITGADGSVVFSQDGVEFPASWSQNAVNIVSQKYFRGRLGEADRESSLREVIDRVAGTICRWGAQDGYFADAGEAEAFGDELSHLLVAQKASFNSPVWFNIGVPGALPQSSACFILSVEDSMESILDWYRTEGLIFKRGSGAGVNLSGIRASSEFLSGGGRPSGPVSFMRGADASAGAIRSGGTTRRAAKMVILDADHPDIDEFVWCKAREERKARALSESGFDLSFDGLDSTSLLFQNANNSVRVTDEFMEAALAGRRWDLTARTTGEVLETVDAAGLLADIAEAAWECADPGLQFDTTINLWHTTPGAGRITASNPCSEYLHVDDSACNLASLNLLAFLGDDGRFDVGGFRAAVRVVFCAQEILVGRSHYPTPDIGANAVAFRQLGLGYANLGALLMNMGLPYDSAAGRATAAAVTAVMCGEAYRTSAQTAARMGPFEEYADNRADVLAVLNMHRRAVAGIEAALVPAELQAAAAEVWDEACELAESVGVRNAQATVLAPTGTISFMMDCDTTGIEPDLALRKAKSLVGGGSLLLVNRSLTPALARLGYGAAETAGIAAHVESTGSVVGAPGLAREHYPVFACSIGDNTVSPEGHVQMMAAVQPFVSGGISKTVNLPADATAAEVRDLFVSAWRSGVKALAVYRDNSKQQQPLAAAGGADAGDAEEADAEDVEDAAEPVRRRLPRHRASRTMEFRVADCKGFVTVGHYDDGRPGEIFVRVSKQGSTLAGIMDAFAVAVSHGLQYGVPLRAYVDAYCGMRFEPAGVTDDPDIRIATSLMDYLFRRLALTYLSPEERAGMSIFATSERLEPTLPGVAEAAVGAAQGIDVAPDPPSVLGRSGAEANEAALSRPLSGVTDSASPLCMTCGTRMVRAGSCYACATCGATSGCS
ncbi:MAG: vitamin B12-dependent ribonucleotide reductase [bacterium]|nr:vitamin B12-dependent ribonucleotide reductase [bacterium]